MNIRDDRNVEKLWLSAITYICTLNTLADELDLIAIAPQLTDTDALWDRRPDAPADLAQPAQAYALKESLKFR